MEGTGEGRKEGCEPEFLPGVDVPLGDEDDLQSGRGVLRVPLENHSALEVAPEGALLVAMVHEIRSVALPRAVDPEERERESHQSTALTEGAAWG